MGIQGLKRLIADNVPTAIKEGALPNYFGRRIAIDASMFLYSFLVAIRSDSSQFLTDANGETTSHLQGVFNRTVRLLECGIKPVYVFDGKPPTLKSGELARRSDRKRIATEQLKVAQEQGDAEAIAKLVKQTVKVTPIHNEESMRLLRLMGVPVVQAPCEAEAQCAELCKAKKVWGVGTEDMDALTLGTPLLLRHLTMSEARKLPINEIQLSDVLTGLSMTNEQFVDLCILLGCDYCDSIKGIGPKRALELMRKHGSIEAVIENLDTDKYTVPENFHYQEARELFLHPEVTPTSDLDLVWSDPDEEGIKAFLVGEKQFSEARIVSALKRIKKGEEKRSQGRIDSFFSPTKRPREEPDKKPDVKGAKRARVASSSSSSSSSSPVKKAAAKRK